MLQRIQLLYLTTTLLFCLFLGACADPLVARGLENGLEEPAGAAPLNLPQRSGNFTHRALEDGTVISTVVDATDAVSWQKLDLDSGYADDDGWDLSFRRFVILSNGGVSGTGGVQLLRLDGANFSALTQAPGAEAPWEVDVADGDDEDNAPDNAFRDWYDYDSVTHALTPKDLVIVVRSSEGNYFKLQIEDYYDDAGTSAVITFRWATLEPPPEDLPPTTVKPEPGSDDDDNEPDIDAEEPEASLYVDARSYDAWVYLKIGSGLTTVSDPTNDLDWDIAIQRVAFRTNSGSSGAGLGGAKVDDSGLSYDELETTSLDGFALDELLEPSGAPGSIATSANPVLEPWYDYHGLGSLTPKVLSFIIRGASGETFGKLQIHAYVSGEYRLSLLPISSQ